MLFDHITCIFGVIRANLTCIEGVTRQLKTLLLFGVLLGGVTKGVLYCYEHAVTCYITPKANCRGIYVCMCCNMFQHTVI